MTTQTISFRELWQDLVDKGLEVHDVPGKYEVIDCSGILVLTHGNKYVDLVWLSRHKTPKHLVKISVVDTHDNERSVTTTTDHTCMRYDRDHFFENVCAKDLKVDDYVSMYDEKDDVELIGQIKNIEDLGQTEEYVYDVEVDDDMHAFYANGVLVHNSLFINLQCISDWIRQKRNLPKRIRDWKMKDKKLFWNIVSQFVEKEVNPFVRNLVHDFCHTSQQDVLTYELEYMSSECISEGKKHYATWKMFDEGDYVDKVKCCGIELKKASVPKQMKTFLQDIYDGVLKKEWSEADYNNYVNELYDKFSKFSVDEIAMWKGYNTERQAVGFLKMQLGATGISKACVYYNLLIEKLGLSKKYDQILLGNKVRFVYIKPTNKYGINQIAYPPNQWPKEFDLIFEIDYRTMFDKIILDPLKRFREACKFLDSDPSKLVELDIFSL